MKISGLVQKMSGMHAYRFHLQDYSYDRALDSGSARVHNLLFRLRKCCYGFLCPAAVLAHYSNSESVEPSSQSTFVDTNPPKGASLSALMNAFNAPVGANAVFQYNGSLFVYRTDQNESCCTRNAFVSYGYSSAIVANSHMLINNFPGSGLVEE